MSLRSKNDLMAFREAKRHFGKRHFLECIKSCKRILKEGPPSNLTRMVLHLLADCYLSTENFSGAIGIYSELVQLEPSDTVAFLNRGFAFEAISENALAIADYLHVLGIDAKNAQALRFIGELYIEMGVPERAIAIILEKISDDCDDASLFCVLGDAQFAKKKWVDAYRAYRLAYALDSGQVRAKNRLSQLEKAALSS